MPRGVRHERRVSEGGGGRGGGVGGGEEEGGASEGRLVLTDFCRLIPPDPPRYCIRPGSFFGLIASASILQWSLIRPFAAHIGLTNRTFSRSAPRFQHSASNLPLFLSSESQKLPPWLSPLRHHTHLPRFFAISLPPKITRSLIALMISLVPTISSTALSQRCMCYLPLPGTT
jgi:hypothetical protein